MRHFLRISTVLILIVMLISSSLAFAELVVVDQFTGKDVYDDVTRNEEVFVSSNCRYKRSSNRYVYSTSAIANTQIYSTAFNGMITNDSVSIEAENQCNMQVYCNGAEINTGMGDVVCSNIGSYKVFGEGEEVFNFRIVGKTAAQLPSYEMPGGFEIKAVTFNDQQIQFSSRRVDFSEEGRYHVQYLCTLTGMSYSLTTTIDNTAPQVSLDGVVDGVASGPVTVLGLVDGDVITCYVNGAEITPTAYLKRSGDYELIVSDQAGNSSTYYFRIKVYFTISAWGAIFLILLAIGGTAGYILFQRKHLKIC